jgi:flagellar assembly protein FliH
LSKAVLTGLSGALTGIEALLTPVEKHTAPARAAKLGRTAAALQRAEEEARDRGRVEGFDSGFQEGYAEGVRQGSEQAHVEAAAQLEAIIQAFAQGLDEQGEVIRRALADYYAQSEAALVELSTALAARILGRELTLDPTATLGIVRQALAEVTHASTARIRLNPFDIPAVETQRDALLAIAPSLRAAELVADGSIRGGCIVETEGGVVDARIETMLDEALQQLREGA